MQQFFKKNNSGRPQILVNELDWVVKSVKGQNWADSFKGGRKNRDDPASYRPISVLPALSKVLETVVIGQFLDYLDEHNLLPAAQHGFRRGHSTVTALVNAIKRWTGQKGAAIASFDYSAAFDTIDKATVQQRLEDIGASEKVMAWFSSYMSGGRQKVRWNGAISSFLDRLHGVISSRQQGRPASVHLRHHG